MTQNTKTTEKRVFRKLEDLNLIDNFLFQAVLSDKTEGEEFARILLSTILGKQIRNVRIVPQKMFSDWIRTSMESGWMLILRMFRMNLTLI